MCKNQKAFTLIELLVVVLIIGILSAIALPQYRKAVLRARFAQVVVYNNAFVQAQRVYFLANGNYATNTADLDIEVPKSGKIGCNPDPGGNMSLCWLKNSGSEAFVAVLQEYYDGDGKFCCAYSGTNFKGEDLCKMEMNNTEYFQGCGEGDGCHCYNAK